MHNAMFWGDVWGPTLGSFRALLLCCGGAVRLLLLHHRGALLVERHGAELWQAVELFLKLLLQFPQADKKKQTSH